MSKVICGDSAEVLKTVPADYFDLSIQSPPYDKLRANADYKAEFDFATIAQDLYRTTKPGGVCVWVVGDATVNGSETGTSFRQALYFMSCGWNLHDTMIWNKCGFSAVGSLEWRYAPVFEYMFVFSKGSVKTFNPIRDRANKHSGTRIHGTVRNTDGSMKPVANIGKEHPEHGQRFNIWEIFPQGNETEHPAPFPEALARDHILSWSNPGDLVLDCFAGSGTTLKMAKELSREYIGIERSQRYVDEIIIPRLAATSVPLPMLFAAETQPSETQGGLL